jgi:hypothetical protein
MSSLLHIAARVEAAVESYVAVRDDTVEEEWEAHFLEELVSAAFKRCLGLIPIGYRQLPVQSSGVFGS